MKFIFTFLIIGTSFTLFAGLKQDKIGEAFAKARFHQTKDTFFYMLSEDPSMKEKVVEMNKSLPKKTYGPYQLMLRGIPAGTRFGLYQCNLFGVENPPFLCSGYIDQSGEAWIKQKDGDIKLSNSLQFVGGMLPGEPIYSLIVLGDKKTYLAACLIPEPLEAYGENGRHVTMELFTYRGAMYLAQGENFKPNEEIVLSIHSKDGVVIRKLQATPQGSFVVILEGDLTQGKQLEAEYIQISTAEQSNPMTISYDWKFLEASGGKKMCNKTMSVPGKNRA
jgi:hypothetical protein